MANAAGHPIPYYHVDAFAGAPFAGNQAAVMPLEHWLDDALLQAVAEENKFAETAFIVPDATGAADYQLRWFTPGTEVALCGHATLASGHVVLGAMGNRNSVTFRTHSAGILTVTRTDSGYALSLPAYAPQPADMPGWAGLLRGAQPTEYHIYPGGYHVFVFENADAVLALAPDFTALAARGEDQYICTTECLDDPDFDTDVLSRVFVPGAGVDEDSVTGSAHCVLTPFWCERLETDQFLAYQASARGGLVQCRIEGDRAILGGNCVTVVEGMFRLP